MSMSLNDNMQVFGKRLTCAMKGQGQSQQLMEIFCDEALNYSVAWKI